MTNSREKNVKKPNQIIRDWGGAILCAIKSLGNINIVHCLFVQCQSEDTCYKYKEFKSKIYDTLNVFLPMITASSTSQSTKNIKL
jgi:hypothetical protein